MESGGDKPKKEETLLIEELLSPRAFEQWKRGELDMFSNIPVRTWATGSPLKEGDDGSERKERHYDPEDLVDYSQGMDAYFAKSVGQIEEGQGDEEEEGDEDDDALINEMENYLAEDNDDNDEQGYSTQFHEVSVAQPEEPLIPSATSFDNEDEVLQADDDEVDGEVDDDEEEGDEEEEEEDGDGEDDQYDNDYEQDDEPVAPAIQAHAMTIKGSPVKNHAVDFVVEAGNDSEEENSYEDDYEAASLEQSHKKGGYNGLFDLNANATADDDEDDEEDGGEESDAEESAEDDGEEYEEGDEEDDDEERMGIENDYNDLLAYMNSPREGGDTHAIQPKKVVSTMFLPGQGKGPMVAALSRPPQAPKPDNGRSIAAVKGAKQPSRDRPRGQKKKVNGASSSSKKHNNKPQKGKKKGAAANKAAANGNEAMRRHKDMLAAMANKRKQEEEEIAVMAEQEKERRRKFKEALLEKAIRSKKAQEEALAALSADKIPSFLHPTHAYKAQSVTKKTADQVNMTEEEILLQDQQKREYIAQIRRKFKEQHKKTLMALVAKKREEEAKHEQLKVEEDQLKEKRRQKLMKMLAEKEASILNYQTRAESPAAEAVTADDHHHHHHHTPAAAAAATFKTEVKATEKARAPKRRPSMDGKLPVSTPPSAAAGSGLAAIRSRQGGAGDEGGEPVATKTSAAKAAAAAAKDKTPPPALAPVAAEQKAKLSEYLQTLAEQKKREEKEKLKLEERKKRRVALLRERILQEAAERKLMQMEDDPKYQVAATTTNNNDTDDKTKKKKKITPEMAEAMAQRLAGNKANTTTAAAAAAQPTLVPKPPAGPKKVATGGGPVTSTSAPSTAAPTKEKKDRDRDRDRDEKPPSKPSSKLRESVSVDAADENQPSNSLLSATSSTAVSTVPARDFNDWKRKNHVPSDGKVFCMTGWYPCVKQALLDRGWHFNPDPSSPYFHLKWTLRSLDVNHETLQPWQLINHFMKNVAITTKCGLIKSLQSLKWMDDVDCSDIIPRAYDLSVQNDIQGFLDDFRSQLAENLLKKLYLKLTGVERLQGPGPGPGPEARSGQEESDNDDGDGDVRPEQSTSTVDAAGGAGGVSGGAEPKDNVAEVLQAMSNDPVIPPVPPVLDDSVFDAADNTAAHAMINPAVFDAACRILETLLKPYEDAYLDDDSLLNGAFAGYSGASFVAGGGPSATTATTTTTTSNNSSSNSNGAPQPALLNMPMKIVSDLDWEIIENYDLHTAYPQGLPTVAPEPIDNFVSNMFNSPDGDGGVDTSVELRLSHALRREKKKHARWLEEQRQQAHERIKHCRRITRHDVERIHTLLYRLVGYHGPQYCLNGTGSVAQNMWIVKPASKSRGRGIMTFNDLPKLLKYVQLSNTVAGSGSSQWVVQKYLENPLIIANRKFDMRQWVLVYDWNPLTIYFFDEFYARFSVEEYSVDNTDMDNVYVHLVNNSIGKNSEHFHKVVTAENGVAIEGYMWSFQDFSAYIAGRHGGGRDIVKEKIQPRMKDIAKWALMCGSEAIEHRKNSWELYGFDFMVDDDYNAWLIEINSSPACDYSTKVTERYVQKALVEILDIVLDVRDWEQQPKKTRGPGPSTGSWECIYRGPAVELPVGSFGTEMTLKGEGYKGLKRAYVAPAPVAAASSASSSSSSSAAAAAAGGGGGGGLLSVGSSESLAPTTVSLKPMANAAATATSRKAAQPSPVYRSQSTVHGNNGGSGSGSSGNNQSAAAAVGTRHSSAPSGSHNGGAGPTGKKDVAAAAYDESDDAFNDSDDEGSLTRHGPSLAQATTTTTTSTAMQATASSKANMHKARRASVGLTAPATATAASNNGGVGAIPVPVKTFTLEL